MPRYLLTPSLYDSWRFYQAMESKEKTDFLANLRKEPITDPDSLANIAAGNEFESNVRKVAEGGSIFVDEDDAKYGECLREVAGIVRGGLWQEKVYFDARFGGMDFLVYGKMDVIRRDTIFDIKFTGTYKLGKYTESLQHAIYMYGSRTIRKFDYLACDGESVYREPYVLTDDMVKNMFARLDDMVDDIFADPEFTAAYLANWGAKGEAPTTDPEEERAKAGMVNAIFDQVRERNIAVLKGDMRHE